MKFLHIIYFLILKQICPGVFSPKFDINLFIGDLLDCFAVYLYPQQKDAH